MGHILALAFMVISLVFLLVALVSLILKSPFSYPYFCHDFDVSGKRRPQIDDYLDNFLISGGFVTIEAHQNKIQKWKTDSQLQVERSILKRYRMKQYLKALNDKAAFKFTFVRSQTRYSQCNYVKSSYKVNVAIYCYEYDYNYICNRYNQLSDIGFECTLRMYHCKNQRKLATRELREAIMRRDHYTCQICGKHMPDEVGLQIDHIIPVSKGGKTVESNLRVLCSKCNASKSNKYIKM